MLMIGSSRLAQEVHAAWRDGMLDQGRDVAPERMTWDTLSDQDKELDKYIGGRLAQLLVDALGAAPITPDLCHCPAGSYDRSNVHQAYCPVAKKSDQ